VSRFSGRTIPEICAMGRITVDDFTSSVAYREIFGLGRQAEAAALTLRQLQRRCGTLSSAQQSRIQGLPLGDLEALADALLSAHLGDDVLPLTHERWHELRSSENPYWRAIGADALRLDQP